MNQPRADGSAEWDLMQALWREQRPSQTTAVQLQRRVTRQTRLMWLTAVVDASLVVALVAFTWWYAGPAPSPGRVLMLAMLWIVNLSFLAFSFFNRRGSWRADSETVVDCIALLHRRARAKVRAARFVRWAAFVQSVVVVLLVWFDANPDASLARVRSAASLALVIAVAYLGWSVWYERRALAELDDIAAARRAMSEDASA